MAWHDPNITQHDGWTSTSFHTSHTRHLKTQHMRWCRQIWHDLTLNLSLACSFFYAGPLETWCHIFHRARQTVHDAQCWVRRQVSCYGYKSCLPETINLSIESLRGRCTIPPCLKWDKVLWQGLLQSSPGHGVLSRLQSPQHIFGEQNVGPFS